MIWRTPACISALLLAACSVAPRPGAPSPAAPRTAAPAVQAGDAVPAWPTYHADASRSGVDTTSPPLTSPHVVWRSPALDGDVYAEPLMAGGRVIAATEGDSLYALDGATGTVAWRTNLGTPEPRSQLPCGNIFPLGITGTPVIDTAAQLVYAVAETEGGHHTLAAVELATGRIRWRRSVDPPGMNVVTQQQRAALTLSGGRVYVAFGGLLGDCGDYHGWVVGVAADGSGPLLDFRVPSGREAGIWAPAGPVVDARGDLLTATGNSDSHTAFDDGNAVLRLSPDLRQAGLRAALEPAPEQHPPVGEPRRRRDGVAAARRRRDAWAPADWPVLNAADSDVGSISPAPVGSGLLFQGGKSGVGYLLHADHLGGIGGQAFSGGLPGRLVRRHGLLRPVPLRALSRRPASAPDRARGDLLRGVDRSSDGSADPRRRGGLGGGIRAEHAPRSRSDERGRARGAPGWSDRALRDPGEPGRPPRGWLGSVGRRRRRGLTWDEGSERPMTSTAVESPFSTGEGRRACASRPSQASEQVAWRGSTEPAA